jgi:hypothetical protein
MNYIELQLEAIGNGLLPQSDLENGLKSGMEILNDTAKSADYDAFYRVASCIVEPIIHNEDALEAYADFMENDMSNWSNWIKGNFGDDWGKVAEIL